MIWKKHSSGQLSEVDGVVGGTGQGKHDWLGAPVLAGAGWPRHVLQSPEYHLMNIGRPKAVSDKEI